MKIRSLVLGSVAAAGLSTAGYAADLGVLTSLDVCDSLGLSGLTISSDTNCLQISGGVEYEFKWGDYEGNTGVSATANGNGVVGVSTANQTLMSAGGYDGFEIPTAGFDKAGTGFNMDWSSKVKAWVKFVGTASSDFGPASAVIKLQQKQYSIIKNEGGGYGGAYTPVGATVGTPGVNIGTGQGNPLIGTGSSTGAFVIDEAYVSVGDTTVLAAGKKSSIMKLGEDEPLNYLGLFQAEKVDKGVKWGKDRLPDGGHGISIVSDLGNGVSVGAALENLNGAAVPSSGNSANVNAAANSSVTKAGTAVGVISYAGDGIAAHLTVAAGGVLDGVVEAWGYHAGFAGTFDMFKVVAAIAGDDTGYWNGLASASATFDMFTLAASVEAVNVVGGANPGTDYGFGASATALVTDTVAINLGGRWYRDNSAASPTDAYQVAASVVAMVTETIQLTGEVGLYNLSGASGFSTYYGSGQVAWTPGGGFTTSLKGEAYSNGAYRATFKAAKTFQ